jgi:TRAP-type mannitol/chloroaromatic compound transport system permease large subunit
MIGLIGVIVLLFLMFMRMPVGFAMTLVGFAGTWAITGMGGGIGILKTVPYSAIASYGFSVIPLFILLGEFAFQGGMTDKLYSSAYKMVGHFKAGLAMATLLACGVFAAISGSSVATAGAMGKVAIPDMKKYNYEPNFSAATVVAGGSLGILIPPSVIAVIYAFLPNNPSVKFYWLYLYPVFCFWPCISSPPMLSPPSVRSWRRWVKAQRKGKAGRVYHVLPILVCSP